MPLFFVRRAPLSANLPGGQSSCRPGSGPALSLALSGPAQRARGLRLVVFRTALVAPRPAAVVFDPLGL
eukprot:2535694-Lingulodinium_polyedra.AAC.1